MTRIKRPRWLVMAIAAAALVIAACGSSPTPGTTSKGTLTVGGFNFPESDILAQLYGQALAHGGYDVKYKLDLGTRAVVVPALKSGQIDLYPGYAASELEYLNGEIVTLGERIGRPTPYNTGLLNGGRRVFETHQHMTAEELLRSFRF